MSPAPRTSPPDRVARLIRGLREAEGLTQEELGTALGTDRFRVMAWERGEGPDDEYRQKLAARYNRDPEEFSRGPWRQSLEEEFEALRAQMENFQRQLDELRQNGQPPSPGES